MKARGAIALRTLWRFYVVAQGFLSITGSW